MLHILTPEPTPAEMNFDPSTLEEFEYVVGKAQMASLSLVVLVLLAAASGVSYMIGRSVGPRPQAPKQVAVNPAPSPSVAEAIKPTPLPKATKDEIEASLFAEPTPGLRYIQAGVVDRGVALVMAEGFRSRGFQATIASGPSAGTYRLLLGPLRTEQEFQAAQEAANRLNVTTFPRQFDSAGTASRGVPAP